MTDSPRTMSVKQAEALGHVRTVARHVAAA
jgi:hypothetical protein